MHTDLEKIAGRRARDDGSLEPHVALRATLATVAMPVLLGDGIHWAPEFSPRFDDGVLEVALVAS